MIFPINRHIIALWVGIFLFIGALDAADTPSSKYLKLNANNDRGFWAFELFKTSLSKEFDASFYMEQRWGSNYRLFWYQEYEFLIHYNMLERLKNVCPKSTLKAFTIDAGCAQVYRIQKNHRDEFKWVGITRPVIGSTLTWEWKGWTHKQRLRLEFLEYNSSHYESHATLRYRLLFSLPWKWTCLKIQPFVSNEFFFRKETYSRFYPHGLVGGLFEDRLRVGLSSMFFNDHLTAETWWQWRTLKQVPGTNPNWFNTYQFGANIVYSF